MNDNKEWHEKIQDEIRDAALSILNDTYYCTRVWEAWQFGTMSEDDFVALDNYDEKINETIEIITNLISSLSTKSQSLSIGQENMNKEWYKEIPENGACG